MPAAAAASSTLVQFLFFLFTGLSIIGQLGDTRTTSAALTLTKGVVEGNPVALWLFKKIGNNATYALKCILPVILAAAAFEISPKTGVGLSIFSAGIGFAMTIRNFAVLKKAGFTFLQVLGIVGVK